MITAIDTNILLDIFFADPTFLEASLEKAEEADSQGKLVACEAAWAEVIASFPTRTAGEDALLSAKVEFSPIDAAAGALAGQIFRQYRKAGGKRDRVVADFLIGAHATLNADRLLTRDRGFYRSYFSDLTILKP